MSSRNFYIGAYLKVITIPQKPTSYTTNKICKNCIDNHYENHENYCSECGYLLEISKTYYSPTIGIDDILDNENLRQLNVDQTSESENVLILAGNIIKKRGEWLDIDWWWEGDSIQEIPDFLQLEIGFSIDYFEDIKTISNSGLVKSIEVKTGFIEYTF